MTEQVLEQVAAAPAGDNVKPIEAEPASPVVAEPAAGKPPVASDKEPAPLLATGGEGDDPPAPEGDEPPKEPDPIDRWREIAAGGDEKMMAHFKRYGSLQAAMKAGYEAQRQLRSGEFKKPLPKDAAPEQVAEWRKQNGMEEKPDDIKFDLGGIVPAQEDKPVLDLIKDFAFRNGLASDKASELGKVYFEFKEQEIAQQQIADREFAQAARDQMVEEMGRADFQMMKTRLGNFWAQQGEDLRDEICAARTPTGRILGAIPEVAAMFDKLAMMTSEGGEPMPSGSSMSGKSGDARLNEIIQTLKNDPETYWNDKAMLAEHQQLLTKKSNRGNRAA